MWIVPVSSPISGLCKICCRSGLLWMCTLCYCRTHLQRGNRWRNCVGEVRRASTFAAGKKNSWHGKNTMSKYCKPAMLRNSRRCKLPPPSLRLCSRSLCLHSPPRWCNSAHSSGQETAGKDLVITVQKMKIIQVHVDRSRVFSDLGPLQDLLP